MTIEYLETRELLGIVGIAATQHASEPSDPGQFTVSRYPYVDEPPITVKYQVAGTATPGSDYYSLSGTVTIPYCTQTATIDVTPLNDAEKELPETVIGTLTGVSGGSGGSGGTRSTKSIPPTPFTSTTTNTARSKSNRWMMSPLSPLPNQRPPTPVCSVSRGTTSGTCLTK